ncbi:hypothetical protein Tco_0520677 [Tanacetum coccineum]
MIIPKDYTSWNKSDGVESTDLISARLGVSSNKGAHGVTMSATSRLQWSGNSTINAEMQQQGCNVKKMESQQAMVKEMAADRCSD